MHRIILALGLALASLSQALRGRSLAVNAVETLTPQAAAAQADPDIAVVTVGLPKGLDPERVRVRKEALIRAGTEGLLAEKLATDAEHQQMLRDKHLTLEATVKEVPATETVIEVKAKKDPK